MSHFEVLSIAAIVGMICGLCSSAPIGPINLWLIETTIRGESQDSKYFVGGVVLADIVFAACAVLGVSELKHKIDTLPWFDTASGVFIVSLGLVNLYKVIQSWADPYNVNQKKSGLGSHVKNFSLGIILCSSNPAFLVFWIAVVSFCHARGLIFDGIVTTSFLVGVVLGDLIWFKSLIFLIQKGVARARKNLLGLVRLCLAVVFLGFGLVILTRSLVNN